MHAQGRTRRPFLAALAVVLAVPALAAPTPSVAEPLDGDGMWIWQLDRADGGDPNAIAARAARYGVEVVVIKAAGGTQPWPQFSPYLVSALQQRGLRVCGYQFVFGARPVTEARVGAGVVTTGADCLIIDAEGSYEGRYAQAQTFIRALRRRIGESYPLGLTSFPYVQYHPAFPYSVFLGPGGAQFNVPQMYWRSIGTSVDAAYSTTYRYNRPYGRPIYPLGQVAFSPPLSQIRHFRQLAVAYGAPGVGWWSWQHALERHWQAVGALVPALAGFPVSADQPPLSRGAGGDLVVWIQQHLRSAGASIPVDGIFGPRTAAAVRAFQRTEGLLASGRLDTSTWTALLRFGPAQVSWRRAAVHASATRTHNGPRSASLRPVLNELK